MVFCRLWQPEGSRISLQVIHTQSHTTSPLSHVLFPPECETVYPGYQWASAGKASLRRSAGCLLGGSPGSQWHTEWRSSAGRKDLWLRKAWVGDGHCTTANWLRRDSSLILAPCQVCVCDKWFSLTYLFFHFPHRGKCGVGKGQRRVGGSGERPTRSDASCSITCLH